MRQPRRHAASAVLAALVGLLLPLSSGAQNVERPPHETPDPHRAPHEGEASAGFLGISARPLNGDLRRHFGAPAESGVLIARVEEGTPAAAAGLEVGDVLVGIDGDEISSLAALHQVVRSRAGRRVEIEIFRDGEPASLSATLGARPSSRRHQGHISWADHRTGFGESWKEKGEEWGEGWAEWGEEFADRWSELGVEMEMSEHWGERAGEWSEIGAEIGARMAEAFADVDWDEMDSALEESMRALEEIDWDEIGEEIEQALEEIERALDNAEDDDSR